MAEGRVAREGWRDGYHCAAEIPDVLSNNQPSDCTGGRREVGALPPFSVPSVPSLACRFPPQIDLAIGRLAFPQWRGKGERKGTGGGEREGSCVVITGDIIIEEGTNALWELGNTLVRGKTNHGCYSQIIHQPERIAASFMLRQPHETQQKQK